ncbi:MAG: U32 family peptidase [Firmicutes bacterium]|nr:U32 family peptidase [Bacillota bacterium]
MKKLKDIELLAPAGDMEGIETALRYGADAIYCGGPFMQLRAAKAAFSEENLAIASEKIHALGKKLYVTVNCFAWSEEIPVLGDYAKRLKDIGVDAIIVSDIGAISEIKEKCSEMEIHVSTQANCMNYKAAEVYWNMGASRVVLARELSIDRIAEIRDRAPKGLQLEAFIHGAMCMSFSGRCLISAFTTGRSGNRGECAQSCRWNYYLMEEKRPGEYFPIEESERGTAILSSKELCAAPFLDKLAEAGVVSFKIEGRMRTPYSIGSTVNAYRMLMDGSCTLEEAMKELNTSSHRPYASGFYLGDPSALIPDTGGYIRDWQFIATAIEPSKGGKLKIQTRNAFNVGEELEAVMPGKPGQPFTVKAITTEEGESLSRSASPMVILTIDGAPDGIQPGDLLRKDVTA